jgi:DNA-binding PadR family transcriptional regulator
MTSIIMTIMARSFTRSPLALAILALLVEAPMHPYRMQQLIKERGKDDVINVERRQSIYQTISQLERAGLIRVRETARDENRPERTVYEITREGQRTAQNWVRDMLASPAAEYPEFPAAVSFLPMLTPDDARRQLEARAAAIEQRIQGMDIRLSAYSGDLPRLFILEYEYVRTALDTELKWVRSVIDDLRSGTLTWSDDWVRGFLPPEDSA